MFNLLVVTMSPKRVEISERERELIEKVARKIVDMELEGVAIMLLQTIKPLTKIGGELAYFYLAPFLPLLEDKGYEFLDTFEKRENIELLIRRMEKLSKERSKEKEKIQGPSFLNKLKKKLFSSR